MNKVLVTGGAGFIGSHLVRALLVRGDTVRVLDDFSTGNAENLAGIEGSLEVIVGDLCDPVIVANAVKGVEFIFHQAAFVSVPKSIVDPNRCYDVNVHGTANLLEAARQTDVHQVVLASSAAVYGDSEDFPLDEMVELRPLSPYAASKQMDEIYAGMYTRAFGLTVVALRYFNVFGPRQSPYSDYAAVIPIFIRRLLDGKAPIIYGDGQQKRDFIFVADVVRANLLAAECSQAGGLAINVCTGVETSLIDLIETLGEVFPDVPEPQFGLPRQGDIFRSLGDPVRAEFTLGFRAQIGLAEGLRETVEWMRK